ncbi:MAG: hypothetical protein KDD55_11885, partial [Bdellovibrionales bacterium]|nr:hypothetical protein [Bdellovibrionales bacterium]
DDKQKSALLCRIAQLSLDRYREYNTNRAHLAANIGSLATTSAALGGLAIFDLSYLSLAVPIGVMSFVGRYAFKRKYQGEGYGARAKAKDVFLSTVDGSSLAFGKWIKVARTFRFFGAGGSLGRGVLSAGTKFVFKRSLHKVGDGALTSLLLADQESGHVKLLSQKERETLLAEIGNVLHTEADRGYRRRDRLFHRTPDINRVFTRLGRELAGQ